MKKSLREELVDFTRCHGFTIDDEHWNYLQEGQRHEIHDGLFSVFEGFGAVAYAEAGTGPYEYLPDLIKTMLYLLDIKGWVLDDVDSEDQWQTAQVELIHSSGEIYQFVIDEVEDSDWVPMDIFKKMEEFAKEKCDKTIVIFFSDDPYRMLALPFDAAEELEAIILRHAEPYPSGMQ